MTYRIDGYPDTAEGVIALIDEARRTGAWPSNIRGDALHTICYSNEQDPSLSPEEAQAWAEAENHLRGRSGT